MIEIRTRKRVRITLAKHYYDLSERYSVNEILNKVIDANDNMMLKLYDDKDEPIYIRASKIESIEVITEQYGII